MLPDEYLALWQRAVGVLERNRRPETVIEKAERVGCVHPHSLSFAPCASCRTSSLSPRLQYLEEKYNKEG